MLPKYHLLIGFIFVAILYFFFPEIPFFGIAIIFLSSFLIDVDHVFYYFFRKRDISPINAYRWYMERRKKFCHLSRGQKKKFYSGFYLFHGIEWLIILFLLGNYVSSFFIFVCIGFSLHLVLDIFHEIYDRRTIDKFSLIWSYLRFRKSNISD